METPVSDIAFTPAVKTQQEREGSRQGYERMEKSGGWDHLVDSNLKAFLAERDSFYLGTASADGRPYIQHRGGPKGFLKVLDESTLAFVDFSGNRQYISMGNLSENNQAYIFLMDYPNRRRVKIWGRAEIIEDDPLLLKRLLDDDYKARPERVFVFHIEAWDTNCPQHIQPRFTHEEIAPTIEKLEQRIGKLEEELATLKSANGTQIV
ncbi:MAG: pyridoxamine 5'-phosphate oxidase [Candidatus Latescibacteria bacterium]|nr:pyridoxamine 5'-phosphate oxidase [Candidatus Latescibacterota bacterium]MBT5832299.1 pyridoxamine 5'-phosphate oxidase [Candidatus Latescibacterota bacterium]